MRTRLCQFAIFVVAFFFPFSSEAATFLKDRLQKAQTGDYIVTAIDKTYTVLVIREAFEYQLAIEEIAIPVKRLQDMRIKWCGWKHWVESGAPGHTSWVLYTIHLPSGQMREFYSYSKNQWCQMAEAENFLSTLLNLRLVQVAQKDMRRVGSSPMGTAVDRRRIWTPQMVYEGQPVYDVPFEAWRTRWPRDCGELSGKMITVYLPQDDKRYPTYFPYWLEIQGMLGKAKIRIIDSGRGLHSPRGRPSHQIH